MSEYTMAIVARVICLVAVAFMVAVIISEMAR